MHLRLVIKTSLYKRVFCDIHLKVELKFSDGCLKVMVDDCELFDCSCSTLPIVFNLIHSTISFWYTDVHVNDNSVTVPLTTKLLIIDLFSISPPLLLIITGPMCTKMYVCMYSYSISISLNIVCSLKMQLHMYNMYIVTVISWYSYI